MVFITRFWSIATVLSCVLLFQNCQPNSLRATEKEELVASSSPSAPSMHRRASSEPPAVRLAISSFPPATHIAFSNFSTPPANKNELSTPSQSFTAFSTLAGVSNAPEDSKLSARLHSPNLTAKLVESNNQGHAWEESEPHKVSELLKALLVVTQINGCRQPALETLSTMSKSSPDMFYKCLPSLHAAANSGDREVRLFSLRTFGEVAKASLSTFSECLSALRGAVNSGDSEVRLLASRILEELDRQHCGEEHSAVLYKCAEQPLLSQALSAEELAQTAIPSMAFGPREWQYYLGEVGAVPDLPSHVTAILDSTCPFWPGKKVRDTHLLVLIPASVDGKPFTLNLLGELIKKLREGVARRSISIMERALKHSLATNHQPVPAGDW